MFSILGFSENITDPRYLSNSSLSIYSFNSAQKENHNFPDLGQLSVFISAILLSLGGFISIVASSIRRSRCQEILCCGFSKCLRDVPNDPEIGV
jgi:hypothetical protein